MFFSNTLHHKGRLLSTHHQIKNGSKKRDYIKLVLFKHSSSQQNQSPSRVMKFGGGLFLHYMRTIVKYWKSVGSELLFLAQETGLASVQRGRGLPILPCLPVQSCWLPFHLAICHLSPEWAKLLLKTNENNNLHPHKHEVSNSLFLIVRKGDLLFC